jgi:hypothetical protein
LCVSFLSHTAKNGGNKVEFQNATKDQQVAAVRALADIRKRHHLGWLYVSKMKNETLRAALGGAKSVPEATGIFNRVAEGIKNVEP